VDEHTNVEELVKVENSKIEKPANVEETTKI
jgi:hypothetical protein